MFNNLIESQSHRKEFKRRGRFVLATTAAYALFLVCASVGSIYAYDARLEAQNNDLMLIGWVPPVTAAPVEQPHPIQQIRRQSTSNAPVDPNIRTPERTNPTSTVADPTRTPDIVGTKAGDPPVEGPVVVSNRDADPRGGAGEDRGCSTCNGANVGSAPVEVIPPVVVKPPVPTTKTVTSMVLVSKVLSMPKPTYPYIAKTTHIQGPVNIQILVSENGSVISAHAVSGNPMLIPAATQAALQARFSPTLLNDQPIKIQGVITYNFVLQ